MYRFITSFIALSVCCVISPVSGNVMFASNDNGAADWVGEKPTNTSDYKNMGIHQHSDSSSYAYQSVCESGEGAFTSVLSADESQIYMACINPYKQWLPNSNNTKNQIFKVTVSNDTPMALRKSGVGLRFSTDYINLVDTYCRRMNYRFENKNNTTLACGTVSVAAGHSSDNDSANLYTSDYWNNVDPTQTNEFINDGMLELIEKGRMGPFCEKCKRGGVGDCTWTDEDVEPFAVACLNPNNGKWLPNSKNMAGGRYQITYDSTVPWVLQSHDSDWPNSFEELYMTIWAERCEKLGGEPGVNNKRDVLMCVSSLLPDTERASATDEDMELEELKQQLGQSGGPNNV
ncbi:MAG: hypothetical protein IKL37_04870, partial [Alphaproteobacteria bacterium]|nr:hypothetical protein [Alphaproteobacteria bacterium]